LTGRNIHTVFFPPSLTGRNIHTVFFPPSLTGRNIHSVFFLPSSFYVMEKKTDRWRQILYMIFSYNFFRNDKVYSFIIQGFTQ
jgi:hypothetical protein